MMNSQAQDLFVHALEFPESARDAFLAGACGGDAELRLEVQRMLVDAARADSFFGGGGTLQAMAGRRLAAAREAGDLDATIPPEAAAVLEALRSEEEGEMIGPYKLLQEIGQGGFGSVWMAQQSKPISRKVALKVIKMGMDTREVIARFEAERQALAMMDHPNIAKVLDAGATGRGRPYFVMELVKGIPITDYCDQAGLGTKERLALFRDVCSAINHAHQKGIIHRDIKPSNVMVTLYADKPVVKVIDFGIAKATQGRLTDQTLFTRFEQFIGTPVYMSPEQTALSAVDIDTRSDIYALGILLYELLVGKPPFDAKSLVSAGYEEMRRIIREVEPVRPSSRLGTIAGEERTQLAKARHVDPAKVGGLVEPDLDWIVMKAIEKDRTRRYETANAFSEDIRRFLADEPVTATPPSAGYQFKKFARRNKAALRVAAAIAAVLVAATVVSTREAIRATRAEVRATVEAMRAREAEVKADTERDATELARKDAEDVSGFLRQVFESPDPNRDGSSFSVAELLDTAAKKLDTDLAGQPALRAKLQMTLASTYHALALSSRAIPLNEAARDYYLAASGAEHPDSLTAMLNLAESYARNQRGAEALKLREQVLTLRRKVLGPGHPDTLWAMSELASSYTDRDRQAEALTIFEEVLTLRRKVLGPEHPDTVSAMQNVAASYAKNGRVDEAIKMFEEALPLRRKVSGPERHETLLAMQALAMCYAGSGRTEEAIKVFNEALLLTRKVFGPEHPNTLRALDLAAMSYFSGLRYEEAARLFEEELPLSRKVLGMQHGNTFMTTMRLASCYTKTGRDHENTKLFADELALSREIYGPEHPSTQQLMTQLINCHFSAERWDEVIKVYEEDLALSRKALAPDHAHTLKTMGKLADTYRNTDETAKAEALEKEIATAKERNASPAEIK